MSRRGFSLVELLVVMTIAGILLSVVTVNWNSMQTKSGIETEIKTIHADLMEVRQQALYTKQRRSVVISGQSFKVYASDDTSVAPLVTKQLRYPVAWNSSGTLTFDTQGLANTAGSERTLCVVPSSLAELNGAAVDSLVISDARINLGLRTGGACNSDNIEQR